MVNSSSAARDEISEEPRSDQEASQSMTVRQAGSRGGRRTLQLHGAEFFRIIGRKGGQRTAELYGDLLKAYGQRGGRPKRPALGNVGEGETVCERGLSSPRQVAKYP
jgi:general stress protein YciG